MGRMEERAAHHHTIAKMSMRRHNWARREAWEWLKRKHPRVVREIWAKAYDEFPTASGKRREI